MVTTSWSSAPPNARKVHNIEQRPTVTLHFNSDRDGTLLEPPPLAHE
jgi:hypothetical protein